MKLMNIANTNRMIRLFCRDENGQQVIINDNDFYPFYYEPDKNGQFTGYDGVKLRKVICADPKEIKNIATKDSYSSDVIYVKNYMLHKIKKLEEAPIKYFFLDIEVMNAENGEFPDPEKATQPVSCITVYNSLDNKTTTWWLKDFPNEAVMLDDFIAYTKHEAPDILFAWNIKFDYTYLHNRVKDFAKRISPIDRERYQDKNLSYPTGISILDYLGLFRKVFMAEQSYKLDDISQKYLKDGEWGDTTFGLNERVREKNINDVKRLVNLEDKFKLIPYYDTIRRFSKVQWEDLHYNSRIVEMLLFEEARLRNIVLPSHTENTEAAVVQGATRDAAETGMLFDIGKFDLGSAYPSMIMNFCLDTQNVSKTGEGTNIDGTYFKQNENALLPAIIKKILTIKDRLKELKKTDKSLTIQYNAIKAVVNSTYGVMGNQYFRLYDPNIAAATTFLVRDLLMYCKKRLEEDGHTIVYWDTDSLFIKGATDITPYLNQLIQDWGKLYGKESIKLFFEYEGYFESIFILGKCHYYGYVHGKNEPEIKGMEIKRSSSSKYEAYFQKELLERVIRKESKDSVLEWIGVEKDRIKTLPIDEIAFPCKIANKDYKNTPIFVRAYENTKARNKKFRVNKGELFYYVFTNPTYCGTDVLALSKEDKAFMDWTKCINWTEVIRRNILQKAKPVFDAMKWDADLSETDNQQLTFGF